MFSSHSNASRPAAVAGQFYPADPGQLSTMVDDLLDTVALASDANVAPTIKAIIAPHAGFIYSGPVAASIYRLLQTRAPAISRVVVLGPSHHVGFHGLALSSAKQFRTPLGDIPLELDVKSALRDMPQVIVSDEAHAREHSLEVQLPFLQRVLIDFALLPLVVGDASAEEVAEVLEVLWGGDETLIVISSDLSHFLDYEQARARDSHTSDAILELDPGRIGYADACGRNPVNGLLLAARKHGLEATLVDLRNSGDTAGSKQRVVGYGAYRFDQHVQ
jgi:AmmeMemoRadiSam system protein B